MIIIQIKKLSISAIIPKYAHLGDSGMDLYSNERIVIESHDRGLVHTGIAMAIPEGYEGCIRPRSGNALKLGLTVLNTPGTVDSNYRGEIGVILYNTNDHALVIEPGDRIAQMVIQEVPSIVLEEVDDLDNTDRGTGGFGSTGR